MNEEKILFTGGLHRGLSFNELRYENEQLRQENEALKILVECVHNGVILNEEQEDMLNKILFCDKDDDVIESLIKELED